MKKTFREKLVFWGTKMGKKHKWLKMPILVYMTICLSIYYACLSFVHNGKKVSCVGVALLFFIISSSFGYRGQASAQDVPLDEQGLQLVMEDVSEEEIDMTEIIEDAEILETFDDVALLDEGELDLYTLDDILEEKREYLESEDDLLKDIPAETVKETEAEENIQNDVAADSTEIPQFDKEDWRLLLVNKQHPIPDGYEFPLGTIKGNLQCDDRIMEDLLDMMQAAKDDNVSLIICSPYRDYNRQTYLFNKKIDKYMGRGLSYMDAYRAASQIVTAPNASEHQLGLAIDFYSSTYQKLNSGFAKTETGIWLKENSARFGFILRYPEGKEYITGIEFEPWHFRYVGKEAAQFITEKEITLEEFWEDYLD